MGSGVRVLLLGTIFDGFCRKGRMLGLPWHLVLALFEGFGFVPGHGQVYFRIVVIPVKAYSDVAGTGPIGAEWIVGLEYGFQV